MSFWKWLEEKLLTRDDYFSPHTPADVIIGVGIDVSADGQEASPQSKMVAASCAKLLKLGYGRRLILAGGYSLPGANGVIESRGMLNSMPSELLSRDITLETRSDRTYLNADYTLPLIKSYERDVIIIAQQWHARRVRATFKKRWASRPDIVVRVIKARSDYGGASQRRLDHFWSFLLWDTAAWIVSKLKGYC